MFSPPILKRLALTAGLSAVGAFAFLTGCAQPPPPEAPVPAGVNYLPTQAPPKPLPESATNPPPSPGPYSDAPILDQRLPEEGYFLDAYNKVHQPRVAVYVNRTLAGQIIPANAGGPGQAPQANPYLAPGDYDEAEVRTLDYQAIEKILSDRMSCGGRVHIISSDYLAAQLSPEDINALSQGRPEVMANLAGRVGADVLIQVQAHPTRQANGPQLRIVAEAINVRGGDSIGNAVADAPLPLQKPEINDFTRFIAAKLMDSMAGAWDSYAANPGSAPPPPASAPPPAQGLDHLPPVPPAPASQPSQEMNLTP